MTPTWLPELRRRLGDRVVVDADVAASFAVDWTGRFRGEPACVVRPRSLDQVVEVMQMSAEEGFGVVPQGGNTGLVGGTAAPAGSVLLNLGSLDGLIGEEDDSVVAAAGASVAAVQGHARRRGRVFGLDMASRDSATVGGAFATNAGGLYACHWGRMREQVSGVQAVLADGSVLDSVGAGGPAAGLDAVAILGGSEGTLAVVTSLRLRLRRPLGDTVVALGGFHTMGDLTAFIAAAPPLVAGEVLRRDEMEVVLEHTDLSDPMPSFPWYLLVEAEARHAPDLPLGPEAVVGRSLWAYRDRITESLSRTGTVHKFDVVVPPSRLAALVEGLTAELRPHRLFVFGHVLMSDFHLNVAPPSPDLAVPDSVDEVVYAAVEGVGGAVAGEHGVGRAKSERVQATMSPGRRYLQVSIKGALDPDGRLNPGLG